MTDYDNQLAHLIKLASNPATKEYAWKRALELERCETGMWAGIAQELFQSTPAIADGRTHMLLHQGASTFLFQSTPAIADGRTT